MQSFQLIIVVNIVIVNTSLCVKLIYVLTMIRAGDAENMFDVQEFFFLILEG